MAVARGDANNDASVDISDVVYLARYIFDEGMAPQPHAGVGDVNCDGIVDVSDITYLVAHIFSGGPRPVICYHYTY
jgi:hypothetical protein